MAISSGACCTICLEIATTDLQVATCGHLFHRTCIYKWIDKKSECPICKTKLNALNLIKLYFNPLGLVSEIINNPECLNDIDTDSINIKSLLNTNNDNNIVNKINNNLINQEIQSLKNKIIFYEKENNKYKQIIKTLEKQVSSYLNTAQTYENKYFNEKDNVSNLKKELFKKNKEILTINDAFNEYKRKYKTNKYLNELKNEIDNTDIYEKQLEKYTNNEQVIEYKRCNYFLKKEYQQIKKELDKQKKNKENILHQKIECIEQLQIRLELAFDEINKIKNKNTKLREKIIQLRSENLNLKNNQTNIIQKTPNKNNYSFVDDISNNVEKIDNNENSFIKIKKNRLLDKVSSMNLKKKTESFAENNGRGGIVLNPFKNKTSHFRNVKNVNNGNLNNKRKIGDISLHKTSVGSMFIHRKKKRKKSNNIQNYFG